MPDEFDTDWSQGAYTEAELGGAGATPTPIVGTEGTLRAAVEKAEQRRDQSLAAWQALTDQAQQAPLSEAWRFSRQLEIAKATYSADENALNRARSALAAYKPQKPTLPDLASGFASKKKIPITMPDGSIEWIDNPAYEPPREPGSISSPAAMAQAQEAEAAGRHKRGTEFPWEQETWRKDYEEKVAENLARNRHNTARLAQEKVLAEAGTAADWRRAQLQASEGLFGSMSAMYPKMAAAAPLPGQEYHLGYEPGGAMADIARRGGFGYNPEQYRIGTKTFDPVEWWRLAQQMGGV